MTRAPITPLEDWIRRKIGLDRGHALSRSALSRYQLQALNRTIDHARANSLFYRNQLADLPGVPLSGLDRLADLPFTTAADIRRDPLAFLCVSQSDVARVVTLESSGTTGPPKRLFFTDADLALTTDFFHHGMSTLVEPGQRVLILMPGRLPGSVGDLLVKALARMDVVGIVHGPVRDPAAAVGAAVDERVDSLVGIPVQVLAMAVADGSACLAGRIRSVLLSTDHVPDAVARRIEGAWNCRVFRHYGMTEMGLGGGVECAAHSGYHLREADLLTEIVDPVTGVPLPDGETGELVVTTVTRQGMPLIRYRSGDLAAFSRDACACGTRLKTVAAVRGRVAGKTRVGGEPLLLADLDDVLFGIESVLDFTVQIDASAGVDRLSVTLHLRPGSLLAPAAAAVEAALLALPGVAGAAAAGRLAVRVTAAGAPAAVSACGVKRRIHDQRVTAARKDANS